MSRVDLSNDFAARGGEYAVSDPANWCSGGGKKSMLDTIGMVLAASGVGPAVRSMVDIVRESGGAAESTILGFGGPAPALMAAFANGRWRIVWITHDHAPEGYHPSSSIVPAAFAVAERAGGILCREMIAAVAAGQDMFLRMRRNVESRQDWHLTTVLGVFAAAASGHGGCELFLIEVCDDLQIGQLLRQSADLLDDSRRTTY
ncbi:MmgE/PrpD family protein [Caballeronia udeis]|uniref:MmgE/PrpD family protein n=2 Tax=Caballeronia udeis TaxID=1232866 RepID=A0A158JTB5_9BURK|nr:MmgE/PrpD family protein [Caballeronia udeis]